MHKKRRWQGWMTRSENLESNCRTKTRSSWSKRNLWPSLQRSLRPFRPRTKRWRRPTNRISKKFRSTNLKCKISRSSMNRTKEICMNSLIKRTRLCQRLSSSLQRPRSKSVTSRTRSMRRKTPSESTGLKCAKLMKKIKLIKRGTSRTRKRQPR